MSSGLRLRRPVFFAAGLRCPVCLRRIALCPVFLPVFRLSLAGPHFPLPVFLSARVSLCPFLPLSVFLSARISPALSGRPPSSVFRLVFLLSFLVFPFIVHRPPLVVRRPLSIPCCPLSIPCCPLSIPCCPLSIPCCPLSIPCRLLSIARCAVHRPALAACCPSPVAPSIVHRSPLVVRRSLRRSSFIARRLLSVAHCPSLAARCSSPVASPVPRRLYLYPVPRRASFRCRSVRITAFVSAESRPACLRELLAVSFRSGFRRSVFPQKCVRPPYLGRRAVSDKITPCILLSGAIFPARPAILLTIWQRLPFGTTFVQIQGVTGAPDPQGGRTPAARKENGKNINN